jgi:aspartyl/asparaginyl beta-hydroxylase
VKNFQYIGQADVIPLLSQLQRQPELWKADTYLRDYPQGPFGDTETVFLRFPPASVSELERGEKDQHECVWMDGIVHLPSARPLILWLMARMEGERLGRCMINKLRPGGKIYPHADTPVHANYWDRHHIVLQASKGANFRCGEETIHMSQGDVWWFQNALEHEVHNNGQLERIHMIVDIRTYRIDAKAKTPTTL